MPSLNFLPAINNLHLLGPTVAEAIKSWTGSTPIEEILVAEIDPAFTGSAEFCDHYGIPHSEGSNCVIIEAVRGDQRTLAACVAPISCRMDINGVVRKTLNGRRASFAPKDEVLQLTQMEYGGITPVGLPAGWRILLDERVVNAPRMVVGAGIIKAKLSLPGKALIELPGAQVVKGLGVEHI